MNQLQQVTDNQVSLAGGITGLFIGVIWICKDFFGVVVPAEVGLAVGNFVIMLVQHVNLRRRRASRQQLVRDLEVARREKQEHEDTIMAWERRQEGDGA